MSWQFVNLSEVAEVDWGNTSITKASYVDSGFPAFSATGHDGYLAQAEHSVDGIVLSAIGARCGKCFLASGEWTAIKNTITIIPNPEKINLSYLYALLNDETSWQTKGAAQPFITLGIARNRKIPLPSLAEQKRIATILDKAAEIKAKRGQAIAKLDELAQSTFMKMFGNQTDCIETTLGECLRLINGRAYLQHELLNEGTPIIRIQNLNGGNRWYYSNLKLPEEKYCDNGDLLFAWSATFGPYIWGGDKSIYHYHIWKIEPKEVLDKTFAFYLLQSITREIKNASHGASMLHMTKSGMEAWPIKLPSLKAQMRFVQFANRLQSILDAMEKSKGMIFDKEKSLQHQAFTTGFNA